MAEIQQITDYNQYIKDVNSKIEGNRLNDPFDDKGAVKVFFGQPSVGHVDILAHDSIKEFMAELGVIQANSKFRFFVGTTGRMLVTFARDTIVKEAIKLGMDWVLFVDDDQVIPRKMFLALARHMDKADIIAPIVFQRVHPYRPVIYKVNQEAKNGVTYVDTKQIIDYKPNSVITDVDAVGFGVVLIRTSIYKNIPEPWHFSNTGLGEDIYLCIRAKQAGARILVDTRIKVGHIGIPPVITELDFLKANKDELKVLRATEIQDIEDIKTPILSSGL